MNTSQKTDVALYHYDPLDRLTSTHSSQRFYRGTRIATEINGERRTSFFEHESTPLAERHAGEAATLLATDRQTSIWHSINPAQRQPQVYSPYGFRSADNGLLSVMGFNGERPDPVTGHYLLGQGHRAYNPVLMRFNSPDTLSPFGKGGINAYAYCANNPVMRIDPTGKSWATRVFAEFDKFYNSPRRKINLNGGVYEIKYKERLNKAITRSGDIQKQHDRIDKYTKQINEHIKFNQAKNAQIQRDFSDLITSHIMYRNGLEPNKYLKEKEFELIVAISKTKGLKRFRKLTKEYSNEFKTANPLPDTSVVVNSVRSQ